MPPYENDSEIPKKIPCAIIFCAEVLFSLVSNLVIFLYCEMYKNMSYWHNDSR